MSAMLPEICAWFYSKSGALCPALPIISDDDCVQGIVDKSGLLVTDTGC